MVNSTQTTFAITLGYYLIVWLIPRLMKNQTPYSLKHILIAYNIIMILVNVFVIIEVGKKNKEKYSFHKTVINTRKFITSLYTYVFFFFSFQLLLMAIKLNYSWTCEPITFSDTYSDAELRVNLNFTLSRWRSVQKCLSSCYRYSFITLMESV